MTDVKKIAKQEKIDQAKALLEKIKNLDLTAEELSQISSGTVNGSLGKPCPECPGEFTKQ